MTQRKDGHVILVLLRARAGQERDLVKGLGALARETREEPGNRQYEFYADQEDPPSFMLYEEFVDLAAAQAHQARASIGTLMGEMKSALEVPPEVSAWSQALTNAGKGDRAPGTADHVTLVRFRLKVEGVEPMLAEVAGQFGEMKGNIRFDFNRGLEDPLEAMICARWASRVAWEAHNARPEYASFGARTKPYLDTPMRRRLWKPPAA